MRGEGEGEIWVWVWVWGVWLDLDSDWLELLGPHFIIAKHGLHHHEVPACVYAYAHVKFSRTCMRVCICAR